MKSSPPSKPFAKRSLGQNFLIDERIIGRIVDELHLMRDELVIEIGPGRGALTTELIDRGNRVAAVELDRNLVPLLTRKFAGHSEFSVIEGDALEVDFEMLIGPTYGRPVKLIANLPYNISTAILQRLIGFRAQFSEMVLMLQLEVVERITAKPGDSERGFLTVLLEAYFESEKLFDVPRTAFEPVPKVTSAVVRLARRPTELVTDEARFRELVSAAFRQKRKTLLNNFKADPRFPDPAEMLAKAGIDPRARAESLSIEDWRRLLGAIA